MSWTLYDGGAPILLTVKPNSGRFRLYCTESKRSHWCLTTFADRFWWRDARVSEITPLPPLRRRRKRNGTAGPLLFDYPITFIPVPHCNPPLPLATYLVNVIPQARLVREMPVQVFKEEPTRPVLESGGDDAIESGMDVDQQDVFGNSIQQMEDAAIAMAVDPSRPPETTTLTARIETDGLLLYVSEASYQPVRSGILLFYPSRTNTLAYLSLFYIFSCVYGTDPRERRLCLVGYRLIPSIGRTLLRCSTCLKSAF